MTTKHTPGPWESSRDGVPYHHVQSTIYAECDGHRVATVFDREANIPLIQQAPEMLDIIRRFVAFDDAEQDDAQAFSALLIDARAVIDAATGGDA